MTAKSLLVSFSMLAAVIAVFIGSLVSRAQSEVVAWTAAVNVSKSGAASQPIIAVAPDGTLHVLWWDSNEGELYARSTPGVTSTVWSDPVRVPAIFGAERVDQQTNRVALLPPLDIRMVASTNGDIHAVWINEEGQVLSAQLQGNDWSNGDTLAPAAATLDIEPDPLGGMHLALVSTASSTNASTGIYYLSHTNGRWNSPIQVYASPYFRTAKPEDLRISVAGDGKANVLVGWDDPQLGQSLYARSADGGVTWSSPQAISGTPNSRIQGIRVAAAPSGDMLLIWQDAATGGCGFVQRVSSDGGVTWGAPQKVLAELTRCQETWSFMPDAEGRLWMIGRTPALDQYVSLNANSLAAWDGTAWSQPVNISLSATDAASGRIINLNCLNVAIGGQSAGVSGCDPRSDVWAARNAISLDDLTAALRPVWSEPEQLSDGTGITGENGSPSIINDQQGNFFALWSQGDQSGSKLYGATNDGRRWSRSIAVLQSPDRADGAAGIAVEPALAATSQGKIHTVWNSGTNGEVLYSWAFARDFPTVSGWSIPIALPVPGRASSWPDITADSQSDSLYVIYAVPYNEQRGIYLTRSGDGGSTWITPTVVFDAVVAGWDSVDKPRLALDTNTNTLHAVWLKNTLPGSVGAREVYYAQSRDQGKTWTIAVKVSEGSVDWPRISALADGFVYVVWNQAAAQSANRSAVPYSVWGRYSTNAGQLWSSPAAIPGLEQVSGPVGLVTDSARQLYLVAMGKALGEESALYFAQWNGQGWTVQDTLRLGQQAVAGNAAAGALATSSGQLHALLRMWIWNQDNTGQVEVLTTGRQLTPIAMTPAPTFTPLPTTTPEPSATPLPTPTPRPQIDNPVQRTSASAPNGLIFSAILVVSFIGVVFAATLWRKRK